MNLPSTYIKFWWSYKLLDPRQKLDQIIITLATITYVSKLLKAISKNKQN